MAQNAREQLLDFLDRKAFSPVLNASPERYESEAERKKLEDAQKTTQSTQRRYHESYKTAEEVRDNFKDDLSSSAAQDVHRELRGLGLPTLDDVKPEFEKLADKLGVGH